MASSTRQSALFGVNDWKQIYYTFSQANLQSYDYETLRKVMIDYIRSAYPETFNDYIESSEFVAILDVMSFMGQALSFRNDLNARENFIDTAERRDSVVKLANLVSYTPKRNIEAQGYIKITSIQTTQNIADINGVNLANLPILWNDPANPNWLEQYNTVINASLINAQKIGRPGNTSQVLGVKTEEYAVNIPPTAIPVVPFSSSVDGINMNFELVSVTGIGSDIVYEIPPAPTQKFNMLYRNDKLGYASPNTGYFFYFKQGTLQQYDFNLAQEITNQIVDINIQGINNTDTWLFQLNTNNPTNITQTLWTKVENVYADAYLQTETSNRTIFAVTSRFNDQVSYTFGDGVFSKIPIGSFRAYVRSGNALQYTIDPTEMQGLSVTLPYVTRLGKLETLTLTLALQTPVSTAQSRESLANIKQRAPTRYYTQNRMVNGEDYTNFPYTLYSSIIKSAAINRSSIGISKNLDLIDPTGKYSSTNSFADDGAIYQNVDQGNEILTIVSQSSIISFLSNRLTYLLAQARATQYYIEYYTRYAINTSTGDGTVYWQAETVDANSLTGYCYNIVSTNNVPIPVGTYSTHNIKYMTKGAMLYFTAPTGYYFNEFNRLVYGPLIPPTAVTAVWTTVLNVVGDGYNFGAGAFNNGTGPITLDGYIPTGAILTTIIPSFDNTLSATVRRGCVDLMELQQSFTLIFDNSLTISEERWRIGYYDDTSYFIKFNALGNNRYSITYRTLAYYFGSVANTRFSFPTNKLVYDPFSGKVLQDYVNMLITNTQPGTSLSLSAPVKTNIIGQNVASDGYVDDFEVEISSINVNDKTLTSSPDFFTVITGYDYTSGAANLGIYAFFELIQDSASLARYQLLPSTSVVYSSVLATINEIELIKYEYAVGQLFYAYTDNKFYITIQNTMVTTPDYIVTVQPQYFMRSGRQGLQFQYRHNSGNTTRIDPATTNIIDLYLVTQAYYTAYQNWIQDTTNTIIEPDRPTIDELSAAYPQINDYKMMSDSVIPNGVVFKPIFGLKAAPALRATVKVIKASATTASDSEIRSAVLTTMNSYFDINLWNFGATFYFSELAAYLHDKLLGLISSVVLVPNDPLQNFGSLYEIKSAPYEIFANGATTTDIQVIAALTQTELQIR
jgi:hypothetical protein